jgi:hypothetical protein
MSYTRQPNVVIAGQGLKQNPLPTTVSPPGIIPVTLDADVATPTSLGVVQVGYGLSITPSGILSTNGGSSLVNVTLVDTDYNATIDEYYIGALKDKITITLPLGIVGKVFIVKNQVMGKITVEGTNGELLDSSSSKTLGSDVSLIVVFDGLRWNLI